MIVRFTRAFFLSNGSVTRKGTDRLERNKWRIREGVPGSVRVLDYVRRRSPRGGKRRVFGDRKREDEEGTDGRQIPGPSVRQAISASLWTPFATLRLPVKYLAAVMEKSLT